MLLEMTRAGGKTYSCCKELKTHTEAFETSQTPTDICTCKTHTCHQATIYQSLQGYVSVPLVMNELGWACGEGKGNKKHENNKQTKKASETIQKGDFIFITLKPDVSAPVQL